MVLVNLAFPEPGMEAAAGTDPGERGVSWAESGGPWKEEEAGTMVTEDLL